MNHWYPRAGGAVRPSHAWYWGWALYVNRHGFLRAFMRLSSFGAAILVGLALFANHFFLPVATLGCTLGLVVLIHSIVGHALVYGAPAGLYFDRLITLGAVDSASTVADLHIGTWRHSYALHDRLPAVRVVSIDIWEAGVEATEGAVRELRELELPPAPAARLQLLRAGDGELPLADQSADVVVLGLGTHEVEGEAQEKLFDEARRILKQGGTMLLFEHAKNWQSFLIFGPGIAHWTEREEWIRRLAKRFNNVRSVRTALAVDLFAADG
jgi:SAM-dependent methyltransferase